jgi:hypothetical protein
MAVVPSNTIETSETMKPTMHKTLVFCAADVFALYTGVTLTGFVFTGLTGLYCCTGAAAGVSGVKAAPQLAQNFTPSLF